MYQNVENLFYKSPLGGPCKQFGGGQSWADTALASNVWFIDSERKTKNWYITLQAYFEHLKNGKFFSSISLILADFS